jgi:hypothetical protein
MPSSRNRTRLPINKITGYGKKGLTNATAPIQKLASLIAKNVPMPPGVKK